MARFLLSLIISVIYILNFSHASEASQPGTAVVVLINRVNIDNLADHNLKGFNTIIKQGSVGLLNNNTGGYFTPENTYLTIGTGQHALGGIDANKAYEAKSVLEEGKAAELYFQRTGVHATKEGVVHLGIAKLTQINSKLPSTIAVGALGTALHQSGYKTAVFGNNDLEDTIGRVAACIAMDQNGFIDYGKVGSEILQEDKTFPGGKRTNYNLLINEIEKSMKNSKLVVVELGDTERLYEQRDNLFQNVYEENFQKSMERSDKFLLRLIAKLSQDDLLMVLSPTPDQLMNDENKYLTPLIVWGKNFNGNGGDKYRLLTSGTTKHTGIVMNTDIAPTILQYLKIKAPNSFSGRSMYTVPLKTEPITYLQNKQNALAITYTLRTPLQQVYVILQIILLIIALWLILKNKSGNRYLNPAILVIMSVPLVYLMLPLLPNNNIFVEVLEFFIVTVAISSLVIYISKGDFLLSMGILASATAGTLLIDTIMGQFLQKQAILSYDPMVGARFYGIGNEYMGVIIGSTILAMALLVNRYPNRHKLMVNFAGVVFAVTVYCMAAPNLGTNVGGTIATLAAFLVTYLLFNDVKICPKVVFGIIFFVGLLLLAFIGFDLTRPIEQQSHIGQTARTIIEGGYVEVWNIISRKVAMNIKVLKYTVWTRVLLASIITLAILFYKPKGSMKLIEEKYYYLFKGFIGIVTGALVAFVFNDSGVVAAATTMIFGAPPLVFLVLKEQSNKFIS